MIVTVSDSELLNGVRVVMHTLGGASMQPHEFCSECKVKANNGVRARIDGGDGSGGGSIAE